MKVKKDSILVRLPAELKQEFKKALQKNDADASKMIRRCITKYIEENK